MTDHSALLQSRITSIPGPLLGSKGDIPGKEGRAYFECKENESFRPSLCTPLVGPDRASKSDNHTNPKGFRDEADSLFQWLTDNKIRNVLILCGDRHWQYHSIHPSGVEELCCGALNDENAIRGIALGDPTSTDPQATIRQPYLYPNPTGGFLHVDLAPNSKGTSHLTFSFCDDGEKLLHQVIKESP